MKPRKVCVTLELYTDEPLGNLKSCQWWADVTNTPCDYVVQAQANVIKPERRVRGRIVPVDQGGRVVREAKQP